MTREEILAMQPGRELDALVAEKVKGHSVKMLNEVTNGAFKPQFDALVIDVGWKRYNHIPRYSTDISAAWEVTAEFDRVRLYRDKSITGNKWEVGFVSNDFDHQFEVIADTAPEAICKAALLAVME